MSVGTRLRSPASPAVTATIAALCVAAVFLTLGLTNLAISDAFLGLSYEVVLVAIPGALVSIALAPGRSVLSHAALAWPLGIAIELACFALAASLDIRFATALGQIGIALALVSRASVRAACSSLGFRARGAAARISVGGVVVAGVATIALLAVITLQYYFPSPLPGPVDVTYYDDVPFQIALGAEAVNHWPITDPNLAGEALPYHIFSYMHMAAVHEVTGIGVPEIVLRTFPLAPLLATVLALFALARAVSGRAMAGGIAVLLLLFAGELDFDVDTPSTYFNVFLDNLWYSPTFLFGLPFCTAIYLWLVDRDGGTSWRDYALLALLVAAATGAKGSVMPVVLAGLALYVIWTRLATRRMPLESLVALAVSVPVFIVLYVVLYSGGSGGLTASFGDFLQYTVLGTPGESSALGIRLLYTPIALGFMLLPLVGIVPLILSGRVNDRDRLLLSMLVSAIVLFVGLSQSGGSQFYFAYFGYPAGLALSARGLILLAGRLREGEAGLPLALASGTTLLLGLALMIVLRFTGLDLQDVDVIIPVALVVVIIVMGLWVRLGHRGLGWAGPVGVMVAVVLSASALDVPGDVATAAETRLRGGSPYVVSQPPSTRGINPGVYEGLTWIRERTDTDSVLAVNNQRLTTRSASSFARFFGYAAFAERRTFLGGWDYSVEGQAGDYGPLRQRISANRAVLRADTCEALRAALADAPVDYVFYDHYNGSESEPLEKVFVPVYENADVTIYDTAAACAD